MGSSLKSFIKDVRNAKTFSDERTIITKQSAKIRTKLRDDHLSSSKKRENIQKLLYLYILGEPTHFAQVECINLIASDQFVDKRLGYLSTSLLLDESQDLLTLLTNLLNNDLNHPNNKYIVSLALSTLGSLSSYDLAKDLYPDVLHLIETSNDPFILSKSLQCLSKLISKDFELTILSILPIDIFVKKFFSNNKNDLLLTNNVWLSICKFLQSIVILLLSSFSSSSNSDLLSDQFLTDLNHFFSSIIPKLFYQLSSLNVKNYESSYDVQGVRDPFLQCEIILTLKYLFKLSKLSTNHFISLINDHYNKFMDLLTQLINNSSLNLNKNPNNAILYEITMTIFELEMDQSLRLLGVNILANFLKPCNNNNNNNNSAVVHGKRSKNNHINNSNSNNIKYVALNTLIKVIKYEPSAIAKHRKFISQCLYDTDISIKFKALELTFTILNKDNLVELTEELIKFLKDIFSNNNGTHNYVYFDIDESNDLINYTVDNFLKNCNLFDSNQDAIKLRSLFEILKIVGNIISIDQLNEFLIIINNIENWQVKINSLIENISNNMINNRIVTNNISWNLIMVWSIGEYGDSIITKANSNITSNHLINYLNQLNILYSQNFKNPLISNLSINKHSYYDYITMIQYILTSALKLSSKINQNDAHNIELLRQIILSHQKDSNLMLQIKSNQYESIFNQGINIKRIILDSMPKFIKQDDNNNNTSDHNKIQPNQNRNNNQNELLLDLLSDINDNLNQEKSTSSGPITVPNNNHNNKPISKTTTLTLPKDNIDLIFKTDLLEVYSHIVDVQPGNAHLELFFKPIKTFVKSIHSLCAVSKQQKLTLGHLYPHNTDIEMNQIVKQSLKIVGSGKLKLRVKLTLVTVSSNSISDETQEIQFDYKFNETI